MKGESRSLPLKSKVQFFKKDKKETGRMFKERKSRKIAASVMVAASLLGASTITASTASAQSATMETFEEISEFHNGCGRVGIKGLAGIDNVSVGLLNADGGVHTGDPIVDGVGVTTVGVHGIVAAAVVEGVHSPGYFEPNKLNVVAKLELPNLEHSCLEDIVDPGPGSDDDPMTPPPNNWTMVWEDLSGDFSCTRLAIRAFYGDTGWFWGRNLNSDQVSVGLLDSNGNVHIGDKISDGIGSITIGVSNIVSAVVVDGAHTPGDYIEGSELTIYRRHRVKQLNFERSCLVSDPGNGIDIFEDKSGDYDCTRIAMRVDHHWRSVGLMDASGGIHIGDKVHESKLGVVTLGVTDIVAGVMVDRGDIEPGYYPAGELDAIKKFEMPTGPFSRTCL